LRIRSISIGKSIFKIILTVALVIASLLSRLAITHYIGHGLPTYITFYPSVMIAALVGGFWIGLLGTALSVIFVTYWVLTPVGSFSITNQVDLIGLAIFSSMGIFISIISELYMRARKKTAEYDKRLALAERERLLKVISETTEDAIYTKDLSSRVLFVNQAILKLLGKPSEQVIGHTDVEFYDPVIGAEIIKHDQRIIESGEPQVFEETIDTAMGQRIMLSSKVPWRDEHGQIIGIIGISKDITERKKAEEELKRTRSILSEGQKIAHLGIFEYVADTQTTIWSEEEYHIYGLDPAGPSPTYDVMLAESIHPDDADLLHQTFTAAIRNVSIYELEHRIVRPDGSVRWVYDRAHPYFDETGELIRYIGATLDITERKQAEEELQRLNQELEQRVNERTDELRTVSLYSRSLIEASLDPLVTISLEGKITDVNGATELTTGRNRSQLVGTDFSDYFTEPDTARSGYRKVLIDGQVRDYPLTIRDASGNMTDVLYNATIFRDAQGKVQGVFAAARDVTETKRIEAELARYHEHLEDLVKERTEKLEAANKELDSFSYSISHDLRAPLRAIDGFARMILKKQGDKFDQDTLDKFNVIRNNIQMMGQLIEDLLAFSRLGRKEINISILDMDGLVGDVWAELQVINPDRNITLKMDSIPPCQGDRTLIKQVLTNLLSNAIKFTKNREKAVVEVNGYEQGGENVYSVKDNGVGFDMAYYDKLFGVFQRLHSAEEFDGTGVGLAIVQRIIHRHGGRVWAEAEVDKGACIYFTLQNS